MRTQNSILNMKSNFLILITQTILSFVVRTIFIKELGKTYLGLDGLFLNILNILSIAELGISSAISFCLYKPLKEEDIEKISILMTCYKKLYYIIGTIMTVIGLLIMPFLQYMIKDTVENLYLIYILYLLSTTTLYFNSYKEILIMADQKNYKLTWINFLFTIIMYGMQVLVLIQYNSFILYLIIQLIVKILQKIFISRYITKQYQKIDFNAKKELEKEELNGIKRNIKFLFFNKIGDLCIYCTDNILISKIVNLITVGLYSNYSSVVTITRSIINGVFTGITASFGNFAIDSNEESKKNIFEIMDFIRFILYGLCTIGFILLINTFVQIWLGKSFLLNKTNVFIICLNFYLMGTQVPIEVVKQALGFYNRDRIVALMQAVVNLILSILLGIKFGLTGILISTTISYIILPYWLRPYYIYKYIFKTKVLTYLKREILNLIAICIVVIISEYIFTFMSINSIIIRFIIEIILTMLLFAIVVTILYHKTKEFKFVYEYCREKLNKRIE